MIKYIKYLFVGFILLNVAGNGDVFGTAPKDESRKVIECLRSYSGDIDLKKNILLLLAEMKENSQISLGEITGDNNNAMYHVFFQELQDTIIQQGKSLGLKILDRQNIDQLLNEKSLIMSGAANGNSQVSLLGASYILIGSFAALEDKCTYGLKILNAETSQINASINGYIICRKGGNDSERKSKYSFKNETESSIDIVLESSLYDRGESVLSNKALAIKNNKQILEEILLNCNVDETNVSERIEIKKLNFIGNGSIKVTYRYYY